MMDVLQFEFMQNALAAGLLASLICGIMGTLVIVNRIVFLSGGIAHASYGGIGLAYFFGWPFLAGTFGFAVAAAVLMAAISLKAKHRSDTIIGVIWAVGMALGIVLLDLTPGYNVDLMSYLFGSILTVPTSELWIMVALAIVICVLVFFYYHDILAMSYDEEFALIRGIPVRTIYYMMIILLAITIVMVIQVVGLILVIALLTIPPYIVEKYAKSLFQMMVGASLIGAVFTIMGLFLSYQFDLTSGAAIILVAGCGFFAVTAIERLLNVHP
ncbi:metal ABC transporter permease [bacterium]|nr:metal ABC transporter permease [bacterium]